MTSTPGVTSIHSGSCSTNYFRARHRLTSSDCAQPRFTKCCGSSARKSPKAEHAAHHFQRRAHFDLRSPTDRTGQAHPSRVCFLDRVDGKYSKADRLSTFASKIRRKTLVFRSTAGMLKVTLSLHGIRCQNTPNSTITLAGMQRYCTARSNNLTTLLSSRSCWHTACWDAVRCAAVACRRHPRHLRSAAA